MDDLSDDLWLTVMSHLGNNTRGFVEQVNARRVCQRSLDLVILPTDDDGVCRLDLKEIHQFCTQQARFLALDAFSLELVELKNHSDILKVNYCAALSKPVPSARFHTPDNRIVWAAKHSNLFKKRPDDAPVCLTVEQEQITSLVRNASKEPVTCFDLTDYDVQKKLDPSSFQKLVSPAYSTERSKTRVRYGRYMDSHEVVSGNCVLQQISRCLSSGFNRITELYLQGSTHSSNGLRIMFCVTPLLNVLCNIKRFALVDINLMDNEALSLALKAHHLESLNLTNCLHVLSPHAADGFADMLRAWKSNPTLYNLRRCVIDGKITVPPTTLRLLLGGLVSEDISLDTYEYVDGGIIHGFRRCFEMFFSLSGISVPTIMSNLEQVRKSHPPPPIASFQTDEEDAKFQTDEEAAKTDTDATQNDPEDAAAELDALDAQEPTLEEHSGETIAAWGDTVLRSKYTNPRREKDRHMMQWYDFTCKSCGSVWPMNSVSVSFRQTSVSECFRNKRKCFSRNEFTRAQNGERFLTLSHQLTPPISILQAAANAGMVAATDPERGEVVLGTVKDDKIEWLDEEAGKAMLSQWGLNGNRDAEEDDS